LIPPTGAPLAAGIAMAMHRLVALTLVLVACGGQVRGGPPPSPKPAPTPPHLLWDPEGPDVTVFPDDVFTRDDPSTPTGLRLAFDAAHINSLTRLPQAFAKLPDELATLDGFGVTSSIVIRLSDAVDPKSLPSARDSMLSQAPILLGTVGRTGAFQFLPYQARLLDGGTTVMLDPLLPLPPAKQIFVAITERLVATSGRPFKPSRAMTMALAGGGGERGQRVAAHIAITARALNATRAGVRLVGVTVFTTQSTSMKSYSVALDVARQKNQVVSGTRCVAAAAWRRCDGRITAVDYRNKSQVLDDGPFDRSRTYELPFTVWMPLASAVHHAGPVPFALYAHGLSGTRDQAEHLAATLAPLGIATLAIDAIGHGQHPTAVGSDPVRWTLQFFGYDLWGTGLVSTLVLRDNFRQSTYDKLQMLNAVKSGLDLDGDGKPDLDPDRALYCGLSLGGSMGPELLALAPQIQAAALLVPGGRVASIVAESRMFRPLLDSLVPDGASEDDVQRFIPLVQTALDRADASTWGAEVARASHPPSLLVEMVVGDETMPNSTTHSLVRALELPVIPPVRQPIDLVAEAQPAPVAGNGKGGRTIGVVELDHIEDGDGMATRRARHGNIYASRITAAELAHFFTTQLAKGTAEILDPYADKR
jgi:hypothetical protein